MTAEQRFFLDILSDHILKKNTVPVDSVNWGEVCAYARRHQVESIVYYQCRSFMPGYVLNECKRAYSASVFWYSNRQVLLSRLEKALGELPYAVVKGSAMINYYPVPPLRTMGDTDIVISPEYKEKAHDILISEGLTCVSRPDITEWSYKKDGMEFELHDGLLYPDAVNNERLIDYFSDFNKHIHNGRPDEDYHFIYMLCHLRKHLMNSGVGFRQFTDLAVLAMYDKELDWQKIERELEKLELLQFARVCFGFIERWFGVSCPIQPDIPEDDFFEDATRRIFSDGVFGAENKENVKNSIAYEAGTKAHPVLFMIKKTLLLLFPGYSKLVSCGGYPFLKGRPYLLPFAWLKRAFTGLKTGKKNEIREMMVYAHAPAAKVKERSALLQNWGLIPEEKS